MDLFILEKVNAANEKFLHLSAELANGCTDVEKIKQYSKVANIVEAYNNYLSLQKAINETVQLSKESTDTELKDLCAQEIEKLKLDLIVADSNLSTLLIEHAPEDDCNAIFEISGEVGGEEANLFARDLYWMYNKYASSAGYTIELIDEDKTELGGYNYVSFKVVGDGAYGKLKFESGIHRVQRVPETEAKGRIHTSTASVMVTPEIAVEDFELDLNDVEITTCHASGAGGQHINKTSSAIRAIYKPTGLTVFCQSRRSQLENKDEAIKIIASKIKAEKEAEEADRVSSNKSNVLGTRGRSEKIRTYNFPENRLTDHRINYKTNTLDKVLQGDLNALISALSVEANKE